MIRFFRAAVLALLLVPSAGTSQDFDAGLAAYNAEDFVTALRERTPLAEQGDATAQYDLGIMYDDGKRVPQDYAEAARWYLLAAEQGEAKAQIRLGVMYGIDKGVPQDVAESARWYRLAGEQGDATGLVRLGNISLFDDPKDYAEAVRWYS